MHQTLALCAAMLHRDFTAYTSGKLEQTGAAFRPAVFSALCSKHPGATPAELTRALHLDWGHSQRSITKLVESGFLTKEKEGRSHRLHLTEKGQEAFAVSHQVFFDWDRQRMAALTAQEQQTLLELLQKVLPQPAAQPPCAPRGLTPHPHFLSIIGGSVL